MDRYAIHLSIEVADVSEPPDYEPKDEISLIADVIGNGRHVLATTTEMTGYQAKNDPGRCLQLLLRDVMEGQ